MASGMTPDAPAGVRAGNFLRQLAWGIGLGSTVGLAWAVMVSRQPFLASVDAVYDTLLPLGLRNVLWDMRAHLWASRVPLAQITASVYLNPLTYLIVAAVFVLERVMPATRSQQRVLSRGLLQDFLWISADATFKVVCLSLYVGFLKSVYDRHLGFLTIQAVAAWPFAARVVFSLFVYDFLYYVDHVIRHRVEVLWYFHMVHHSQREMNLFTEGRVHVMDYLVSRTAIFIPVFMLQIDVPTLFWIAFLTHWYIRVYHANLRTNFGPLKYVMVTPQSHRIHHSLNLAHYNSNFGVLFTLWDRAFGTLYPNYDEYPEETGVEDERLPLEQTMDGLAVFATYLAQLAYPFRLLIRRAFRRAAGGPR